MRFRPVDELVRFQRLVVHLLERRDAVVPLEQRRRHAAALRRVRVKFPHRVEHRMIVRIQNILLELGVSRDVHLADAVMRTLADAGW